MTAAVLIAWAAALVAVQAGNQAPEQGEQVWGTVPAWVSAIGASLAFLLTFALFLQGRRDRIREQAQLVYATEDVVPDADGSLTVTATVHNKSTAPIWEVEIFPRWIGSVAASTEPGQPRPFIEPEHPESRWQWRVDKSEVALRQRSPCVVFCDSAGRQWEKVGAKATRLWGMRRALRRARSRWDTWWES